MRAGWQARLTLLRAVASGEARRALQGVEEEQRPGFHLHMRRGVQAHRAQGGPAGVEEGRRHGSLLVVVVDVGVDVGLRITSQMGRQMKVRKEPNPTGRSRLLRKRLSRTKSPRLSERSPLNLHFPERQTELRP